LATVTLKPMPRAFLKVSEKFRPNHPPVFDGDPTTADIEEARALFVELDEDSQHWYGKSGIFADAA